MKSAILKSYCYIDPSAGPCILFRNWLIWLDSFDKSEILISTEMVWPGQFWQMECVLCLFRIKSSVKHSWALSLSYTNNISYTKRLSRLHLFKAIFTLYRMAFAPARKPYRIGLLFTHTAPINVNPVGGGGSADKGRGFDAWDYSPCRAFDRVKRPRGRDIWLWPTEAWYQFRSGYQVRPSKLPESHAVGERYEVFIWFNRHNPIL